MSKRKVYRVQFDWRVRAWRVRAAGVEETHHRNKVQAVGYARTQAIGDERAQVVVHKKDGTIQTEYTYPRSSDPRRHKG